LERILNRAKEIDPPSKAYEAQEVVVGVAVIILSQEQWILRIVI
jgi:hypothetical protein